LNDDEADGLAAEELFPNLGVRDAFVRQIGTVLVDEGDFGTVLTR
jgi:hypothetical protein